MIYFSGDLGDFASFVTHMKELALDKDVDLLLVDTGDVHDGTGLSDGFPTGDIDGHDVSEANPASAHMQLNLVGFLVKPVYQTASL